MAKYNLTNKAIGDLASIWEYTYFQWSEKQADRYYNILIASCQNLSENPRLGKNYDRIAKDLFGFKISKHIIFYRIMVNDEIEIARILFGGMDLKNRIQE